jgi:hypothetical protein
MILIPRRRDDTPDSDQPPAATSQAELPRQTDARPGTINCGEIARKPRAIANALQKLHGI